MKYKFDKKHHLSWSALSSFEFSPEQWFSRYILKEKGPENAAMSFGKAFAKSCEDGKPLIPMSLHSKVEYPVNVMFDKINLVGFIDSYEPHTHLLELKTGKKPWDQTRVDLHGQITMYALCLYIQHKVRPEDIDFELRYIPTQENGDFSVEFVKPVVVHSFKTKRSMQDILEFGTRIKRVHRKMENYVIHRSKLAE